MTAPALSIVDATRFEVPCTWHDGTPATLLVSTLNDGQWAVSCSVVKGWAVLFLRDGERPPWATEQIGQAT